MVDEMEQEINLERERMKYTILAGNMHLYDQLYKEDDDLPADEEIEWFTPKSAEDVEQILTILQEQEGQETGL
jgi:hypothetical protein